MAELKRNHNSLLSAIQENYNAAAASQLLIPAAMTCALISRRALGVLNRQDQLQLSSEILNTLNYLSEHDYIAYLVFINRIDLIREIFWEKDLFAEQLAFLDELEYEIEHDKRLQQINELTSISIFKRQQELTQQQRDREQRLADEKCLISIDCYSYCIQLTQAIHNQFYTKQMSVLDKTHQGRIERIARAVDLAQTDSTISIEDKNALIDLHAQYQEEYEAIRRISIHKPDGSIDSTALKHKAESLKEINDKFTTLFTALLNKYPHNQHLRHIQREEAFAVQTCKQELIRNEKERDKRLAEIQPYLEQTKRVAKEDLETQMKDTMNSLLKGYELTNLSKEQSGIVDNAIETLNRCITALHETNIDSQIKMLASQFNEELIRVKTIINRIVKPEELKELDDKIKFLGMVTQQLNTNPSVIISSYRAIPIAPPAYPQMVEQASSSSQDIPPPSYSDVLREDEPPTYSASQSTEYKARIKDARANHAQHSDVILKVLDDTHKEVMEEFFSMLPDKINEIRENVGFTIDEERLITQLVTLSREVAPTIKDEVDSSKIKQMKELLQQLEVNHSEFNENTEQLESILDSFGEVAPRYAM